MPGERIRIRGTVQGVGFRPTVARLAQARGLSGFVLNDAEGVVIGLSADAAACEELLRALQRELPPLARIDAIERRPDPGLELHGFEIRPSEAGAPDTQVAPDAVPCAACRAEVFDPAERRFRYPFTNCTHCGPRLSILESIPYDREHTSMKTFAMCEVCRGQYEDPTDRRYHAQPIACPRCGPRVWIEAGSDCEPVELGEIDAVTDAAKRIRRGEILAVKGVGCFHLVCDATQTEVVARLRARKRRPHKPFALMVRDLGEARIQVELTADEEAALASTAGPIVIARRAPGATVVGAVAPDQPSLGVMLPPSPLHHLLMAELDAPVVCTSANLTEEPPCMDDTEAKGHLHEVADAFLLHDRPIRNRVEDSIVRTLDGRLRTIRRARGFAPAPTPFPAGFDDAPTLLALGGHLKSAFAMLHGGRAVLSPYHGDLDHPAALDSWRRSLHVLTALFDHGPSRVVVDAHGDYAPTRIGEEMARAKSLPIERVLHHHAHVAACLVENRWALDAGPVLGIALDGIGMGERGALWGGELFVAGYGSAERVGGIQPVPLLGRDRAAREPWRNLVAHLRAHWSWDQIESRFGELEGVRRVSEKPTDFIDQALARPHLSPPASSTGRLFDAVAAALGLFFDRVDYEGQAAIALENLVTPAALEAAESVDRYPVTIEPMPSSGGLGLTWGALWEAILTDLAEGSSPSRVAARFHLALAEGLAQLADRLGRPRGLETAALSGGVLQNRVLTEALAEALRARGWEVLLHAELPANDGGLAVGQAAVAAARALGH